MAEEKELSGIIPVNKPQGWTSFDVIAKLRGILRIKRLGHSGTLDPMATGVLPVFVGKATKACDMLPYSEKSYKAGFKLGLTTDTQDITGKILTESGELPSLEQLKAAAEKFTGDIMQIPPMYSAVKVGGKKLYELAREGKTVEREPRLRHIDFINIVEYSSETGEGILYTDVSKGTYIRTLIHDMGQELGCGGAMTSLTRLSAAGFCLEQCVTVEEIQKYADEGRLAEILKPLESCFESIYPRLTLSERCTPLYKNGVKLRGGQVGIKDIPSADGKSFCIFGSGGDFLGIAQLDASKDELKSVKNFY